MKIPFDIKFRPQIESGEYKVETEAGSPAKVMDWEYNNKICGKCIAVKVIEGDGDHGLLYTYKGKRASIFLVEEGSDLFLVTPEPELTEFEEHLKQLLDFSVTLGSPYEIGCIKTEAAELLAFARKELCKQIVDHTKEAYENGKAEALKDLPRWEKCDWPTPKIGAHVDNSGRLIFCGKYVNVEDLEKLPGFND